MISRKFLTDIGKFIALQSTLACLLMWAYYRTQYDPFIPATNIKHARLHSAQSPRAIFIGGSNLMFGLESELVESSTEYEPVNMGLIAGLRLSFMLNEVKRKLKSDDIVILALEYHQLNVPDKLATPQVLMGVIEQRPQSLLYLNIHHWKLLSDRGFQEYIGSALRISISSMKNYFPFEEKGPYQPVSERFNQYGDLTMFRDTPPQHEGNYQEVLPNQFSDKVLESKIRQLNRFYSHCQLNGVDVFFTYPPIPQSQYSQKGNVAESLHKKLLKSLNIPILHTPSDMVFSNDNFINESYHLHGPAIRQRTQLLVDAIQQYKMQTLE